MIISSNKKRKWKSKLLLTSDNYIIIYPLTFHRSRIKIWRIWYINAIYINLTTFFFYYFSKKVQKLTRRDDIVSYVDPSLDENWTFLVLQQLFVLKMCRSLRWMWQDLLQELSDVENGCSIVCENEKCCVMQCIIGFVLFVCF